MRVLMVHNRYRQPGGEEAVVDLQVEQLQASGHQVTRIDTQNPENLFEAIGSLAISPWNAFEARSFRRVVGRAQPDVAHFHNTWFKLSPSVVGAAHAAGLPTVVSVHNHRMTCSNGLYLRDGKVCRICLDRGPWPAVRFKCYRGSSVLSIPAAATIALQNMRKTWQKSVDVFLAPSSMVRDHLIAIGIEDDAILVQPHFVRDAGIRCDPPSASSRVLYVGRIAVEKGILVLLEAWKRQNTPYELHIIGDGPLLPEIAALAGSRVVFRGRLPPSTVMAEMLSARALIFPSQALESFGLVCAEAFSAGLPVLASDHGSAREIVGELDDPWLVPAADVEGWTVAIDRLPDAEVVDSAGARGRELFRSRYSPDWGSPALLSAYELAIRRRGVRGV